MWYPQKVSRWLLLVAGMTFLSDSLATQYDVVFIRFRTTPKYGPYDRISLDMVKRGKIVTITRMLRTRCAHEVSVSQEILTLEESAETAKVLKSYVQALWRVELRDVPGGRWELWFGEGLSFSKHTLSAEAITSNSVLWSTYQWLLAQAHEHLRINYYLELPPRGPTCTLNVLLPEDTTGVLDHWFPLREGTSSLELPCGLHTIQVDGRLYKVRLKENLVTNFSPESAQ